MVSLDSDKKFAVIQFNILQHMEEKYDRME
jgi:hypothetical protein